MKRMRKVLSLTLALLMTSNALILPSSAATVSSTTTDYVVEEEVIVESEEEEAEEEQIEAEVTVQTESYTTFTLDSIDFEFSNVTTTLTALEDEEVEVDLDDPTIAVVEEELQTIKVLNDDGESVALTDDEINTVLYLFSLYTDQWEANANILGVQTAFFLQFNDSEDSLGTLGEMLVLAGYTTDDVRNGNYTFDDLVGMIYTFYYGDNLGVAYYGDIIEAKRDEAMETVENSGAITDAQKLLVLTDWLSENSSFDMAYIMNASGDETMSAEDEQAHDYYDEIYAIMYDLYYDSIYDSFYDGIYEGIADSFRQAVYEACIEAIMEQAYADYYEDEDELAAAVDAYMEENAEAIAEDALGFILTNFGEEAAAEAEAQADYVVADAETNGVVVDEESGYTMTIEEMTLQQMDTAMDDLGGMTPNEATAYYTDQAAIGLTEGVIGYWQGSLFGALAEDGAVCLGYTQAFAYLVQCMYPEYYGVDGAGTDMTVAENWKTASELYYDEDGNLDIYQDYNVDVVRVTFDAEVSMYGEVDPSFNSDHFWNAVKVDGVWYYIDPCYIDIWSETMSRERVETDGALNHVYFLISHTSLANMLDGNYEEIKGLYEEAATDQRYEDTWFSRSISSVDSDGEYFYYVYDSTDLISFYEEMQSMSDSMDFDDFDMDMSMDDATYKLVGHEITDEDLSDVADTDYTTFIEFNYFEDEDDTESVARVYNPTTGEMEENEMLTELYAQFEVDATIYPSIQISSAYYDGKLYFALSTCLLTYDLETGEVVLVKEYNTVYAVRDDSVEFGGLAFSVVYDEAEADLTVTDHPIAGITIKEDGNLYVSIATNYGFISGKDAYDYADSAENGYGYEFEESNYNPDYSSYSSDLFDSEEYGDMDMSEMFGMDDEINDNDEFMWVANFVEVISMDDVAGTNLTYSEVSIDATCEHDAFTENRTEYGIIEDGTRVVEEDTMFAHYYVQYDETYYTTDDDGNWNTGTSYVCVYCGLSVCEPTEPTDSMMSDATDEDWEEYYAELEIYEAVLAEMETYTYDVLDADWSADATEVTFSELENTIYASRQDDIDCLVEKDDIQVTLDEAITVTAEMTGYENLDDGTAVLYYTATGEIDGYKYSVTTTLVGDTVYETPDTPEMFYVYSTVQTSAKVVWYSVDDVDGYQLWRATSPDADESEWELVKTVNDSNIDTYAKDDGTLQYTNVDLEIGTTYYYKVCSYIESGEDDKIYSEYSEVKFMPATVVYSMLYSNSTTSVRLLWNEVSGADGYQIWRSDDGGETFSIVKTIGDQGNTLTDDYGDIISYTNEQLESGVEYIYMIRAYSIPEDGTKVFGTYSDTFVIEVQPDTTVLTATSTASTKVNLEWDAVDNAEGYQIWMSTTGEEGSYSIAKSITDGETTSYTKYDLESGETYYFQVRAYAETEDTMSFGVHSEVVSVTVE